MKKLLPLKDLAQQAISLYRAKQLDFNFLKSITLEESTPEFLGFNTRLEGDCSDPKPATIIFFAPLINSSPKDPAEAFFKRILKVLQPMLKCFLYSTDTLNIVLRIAPGKEGYHRSLKKLN